MKRASYREAVRWIAENDEPNTTDYMDIAQYVSTLLVADLFGKDPYEVGHAIATLRVRELGISQV